VWLETERLDRRFNSLSNEIVETVQADFSIAMHRTEVRCE